MVIESFTTARAYGVRTRCWHRSKNLPGTIGTSKRLLLRVVIEHAARAAKKSSARWRNRARGRSYACRHKHAEPQAHGSRPLRRGPFRCRKRRTLPAAPSGARSRPHPRQQLATNTASKKLNDRFAPFRKTRAWLDGTRAVKTPLQGTVRRGRRSTVIYSAPGAEFPYAPETKIYPLRCVEGAALALRDHLGIRPARIVRQPVPAPTTRAMGSTRSIHSGGIGGSALSHVRRDKSPMPS